MKITNKLHPGYYSWKYPSCWIKNIKIFFSHIKYAFQRAKRGYADSDVWDLDYYLLNLFIDTLSQFANNTIGYPDTEEFPTIESWKNYLTETVQLFYQADESNNYYPTPKFDEWYKENKNKNMDELLKTKVRKEMFEELKENNIKREEDFKKAWEMMGKVFFHLWY